MINTQLNGQYIYIYIYIYISPAEKWTDTQVKIRDLGWMCIAPTLVSHNTHRGARINPTLSLGFSSYLLGVRYYIPRQKRH